MNSSPVYYNEIDRFAAAWLRELIAAGQLPQGDVDERDIRDVTPGDLAGYAQCHFFAGIGGWPLALRMAGWPDDRPVWTGSCPCQPFSEAGKRNGVADERHLWPSWHWLIQQCRPATVFGEQVASKLGRSWLGLVSSDLEALGYSTGAADLCAASVGAPHIRQRLFWVAHDNCGRLQELQERDRRENQPEQQAPHRDDSVRRGRVSGTGNSSSVRPRRCSGAGPEKERGFDVWQVGNSHRSPSAVDWIYCLDGKTRPIKPGLEPLVDGAPNRMGRLRGYGNAIVPQVAQMFVESFLEASR